MPCLSLALLWLVVQFGSIVGAAAAAGTASIRQRECNKRAYKANKAPEVSTESHNGAERAQRQHLLLSAASRRPTKQHISHP